MDREQRLREITRLILFNGNERINGTQICDSFGISEAMWHEDRKELISRGVNISRRGHAASSYYVIDDPKIAVHFIEDPVTQDIVSCEELILSEKILESVEAKTGRVSKYLTNKRNKSVENAEPDYKLSLENLEKRIHVTQSAPPFRQDIDWQQLLEAVSTSRIIRFEYQKVGGLNQPLKNKLVQPHDLVSNNGHWYLIAREYKDADSRKRLYDYIPYHLNRIVNMELTEEYFERNHDFKLTDHFDLEFGIFHFDKADRELNYKIKFDADAVRFLDERDWHESFPRKMDGENRYMLEFTSKNLEDVFRTLLPFLPKAEIIEPQELKDRLKVFLEDIHAKQSV